MASWMTANSRRERLNAPSRVPAGSAGDGYLPSDSPTPVGYTLEIEQHSDTQHPMAVGDRPGSDLRSSNTGL